MENVVIPKSRKNLLDSCKMLDQIYRFKIYRERYGHSMAVSQSQQLAGRNRVQPLVDYVKIEMGPGDS